jgi:hypothetical protein
VAQALWVGLLDRCIDLVSLADIGFGVWSSGLRQFRRKGKDEGINNEEAVAGRLAGLYTFDMMFSVERACCCCRVSTSPRCPR